MCWKKAKALYEIIELEESQDMHDYAINKPIYIHTTKCLRNPRGTIEHDYAYTNNKEVLERLKTVPDWESPNIPMRTLTNGTVVNGSEES